MNKYDSLVNRLRGIYTVPVNDGAGPLNGSEAFTRKFDGLPPINEEAALAIEELDSELKLLRMMIDNQGISDDEFREMRQWAIKYGPPNCWTGTTGTGAAYVFKLLGYIGRKEMESSSRGLHPPHDGPTE